MIEYLCIEGQSLSDVILNTYGSMDFYVKGLFDNGLEPEKVPVSGQRFLWDNTVIDISGTAIRATPFNEKYATLVGFGIPDQPNPSMSTYKDTLQEQYTATNPAGETLITITALQGNEVIQIDKEIRPLKTAEFSVNNVTGVIQLLGGLVLEQGETLFIIYKKTVSV